MDAECARFCGLCPSGERPDLFPQACPAYEMITIAPPDGSGVAPCDAACTSGNDDTTKSSDAESGAATATSAFAVAIATVAALL